MKAQLPRRDWAVIFTTCLAFGGVGAVFACICSGDGIHSLIGKEALYLCLALQIANLVVVRLRERRLRESDVPQPSVKMQRFHAISAWVWRAGVLLLLASLVAALCGLELRSAGVYYPCLFGTTLTPLGWLGVLAAFSRRRQAGLYVQTLKK